MSVRIFVLFLQITTIKMYTHRKPLEQKIWSERCLKNSVVLNDCNWCRCNDKQKYDCKARVCEEIDMFGHFKDAIQEIDVGMEGRGSWRSKPTYCTPGVHYRRGDVLCVCDEDGNWPNPVCRDLFQILHSIEDAGQVRLSKNESCSPTKLYLVGCNICFCPSSGYLNSKLCTNKECQEDDPILEANAQPISKVTPPSANKTEEVSEIYANCDPKDIYKLGCRTCECLKNNRLICDNCTLTDNQNSISERSNERNSNTFCSRMESNSLFNIDCNLCYCSNLKLYCTVKTCVTSRRVKKKTFLKSRLRPMEARLVNKPPHDANCEPGTTYIRDCNICVCGRLRNGIKAVDCTRLACNNTLKEIQRSDCVRGTYYEIDCTICLCYVSDTVKHQICRHNIECIKSEAFAYHILNNEETNIALLRGHCEPMRKYKRECNTCRCRPDGLIMACRSAICAERAVEPISVDVVAVQMTDSLNCARGQSFKLDCNLCFCLSNGNAICTSANCSRNTLI